jgi:hypothetical protein
MPRVDRHKLHFGPYRTPRFKYGSKVECLARGELTITKLTSGRIPWPIGQRRTYSLVLYRDLARAGVAKPHAPLCSGGALVWPQSTSGVVLLAFRGGPRAICG